MKILHALEGLEKCERQTVGVTRETCTFKIMRRKTGARE